MNYSLRTKIFLALTCTALALLAGGMALAKPSAGGIPDCPSSGSPSDFPSEEPSAQPSGEPSTGPSGQPCDSGSPSASDSGGPGGGGPSGTIAGTLTNTDGSPLKTVQVQAFPTDFSAFFTTFTGNNGRYRMDNLPPGRYFVAFLLPDSNLIQYLHQKVSSTNATVFTVRAGKVTTANDKALPTGTITGHFRTRTGQPIAFASVSASSDAGASSFNFTDQSGAYTLHVFAGTYRLQYQFGSGVIQYAHQQTDFNKAAKFKVGGGATVVVDETALPGGTVSGRLTESNGGPASFAQVELDGLDVPESLRTTADADGKFEVDSVPVGSYLATIATNGFDRQQYVFHTIDRHQAATIKVAADKTTTVNDQFLPTGKVTVIAKDAKTGAPIPDFCITASPAANFGNACSDGTGQATLDNLPAGDIYEIDVNTATDAYLSTVLHNVKVTGGATTTLAVAVQRTAIIQTTAVDSRTNQPLSHVCVSAQSGSPGFRENWCSDDTGQIRIANLAAGTYELLARPQDGVHGMQWVGPNGGTGSQYTAKQITVTAGQQVTLPPIKLDLAGSISGTVTAKSTGKPVQSACVSTLPVDGAFAHIGGCPDGAFTDKNGRYTLTGLGPYAWPVEFATGTTYAWQWSGGVASRKQATPVKVSAGHAVTSDAKLVTGTLLSGKVTDKDGTVVPAAVGVVNVDTGDAAGALSAEGLDRYTIALLPQTVKITYQDLEDRFGPFWYRNARDVQHATPVQIGNSPVTINLAAF